MEIVAKICTRLGHFLHDKLLKCRGMIDDSQVHRHMPGWRAWRFDRHGRLQTVDIAPEGLVFVGEEDSPNGKPLLIISHEISSTTTILEIVEQ